MIHDRKLIALTLTNIFLVLAYVFLAYAPAGSWLSASVVSFAGANQAVQELTVAQAARFGMRDPHENNPADAVSVGLMYEPLIRFDAFLSLTPALATSWYWQDDTELVVQLRDALFHSGATLSCAHVGESLTRAQTAAQSGIASLFAGVTVASHADTAGACVFTLPGVDHTFTRKLTKLFIATRHEMTGELVGTGRYELLDHDGTTRIFTAFADHYARGVPAPETISVLSVPKKYQRLAMLRSGEIDILLDAPSSFVTQIQSRLGYHVDEVPSAETSFLLFNTSNAQLAEQAVRSRIAAIIRSIDFDHSLEDRSLSEASQFAPSGIFGFAPTLLDMANAELAPFETKVFLSLAVSEGNRKIGQVLQRQLEDFNIDLRLAVLPEAEVVAALTRGEHDMFVLGWRYDLGTVDSFFTDITHSPRGSFGSLNGFGYGRAAVDAIIERALTEPDEATRLSLFQELMVRIVREDVIGAPLLDTRRLYAVRDGMTFQPRVDGLLIFD